MRLTVALAEAARTAWAQRVSSVMVGVLCAATCSITLLTVGRTAAAEHQVLSRLDAAGSRLLVVSDDRDAGLVTPGVIDVLAELDTVERVIGVDGPFDVLNPAVGEGGNRVPAWRVAGDLDQVLVLTRGRWPQPGEAVVADEAQRALGLTHPAGAVLDTTGFEHAIVGSFAPLSPFEAFGRGAVVASDADSPVRSVQLVVSSVEAAGITETLTLALLAPPDPTGVTVQSPRALADLQRTLGGDLGEYGRGLLLLTLGGGALLIAVVVLAEVLLRRRDLGRRRALGAPRWGLVVLVVARTVTAAIPGTLAGVGLGVGAAVAWAQAPPGAFVAGTGTLTILVAIAASIPPAAIAAGRDPVGILRTP